MALKSGGLEDIVPDISIDEIWNFLHSVEDGSVTLACAGEREPQEIYSGKVAYSASNGWQIVIFNDCNEWDYIEEIETADGRRIVYDEIDQAFPGIRNYSPGEELSWTRYRIPGPMSLRCPNCDHFLRRPIFKSKCVWVEPKHCMRLICPQPNPYWSQLDESHFFGWLREVEGVIEVRGLPEGLSVYFDTPTLSDSALRDLIALLRRYNLPMSFLRAQLTPENEHWFKSPQAFWYGELFGQD